MRISKIIKEIEEKLQNANIDLFESKLLLSRYYNVSIGSLFTLDVNERDYDSIMAIVDRRLNHEPLDIIFGKTCFYGRDFIVTSDVLSPRLDSEVLIEEVKQIATPSSHVLDLCTGSGALGITIKLECNCSVTLSDISSKAINVSKDNMKLHNVELDVVSSDLFQNINGRFDIIVSNPPYIKTEVIESLDEEVRRFDPIIALDGGSDGLDFYRLISFDAKSYLNTNGYLLFEIGYDQAESVKDILIKDGYVVIKQVKDFGGNDRVIVAKLNN